MQGMQISVFDIENMFFLSVTVSKKALNIRAFYTVLIDIIVKKAIYQKHS